MATAEQFQSNIDKLTDRIEHIEARIERWGDKPQTERRIAKIARQQGRIERAQAKIAANERDIAFLAAAAEERAASNLPVDTFEITFKQPDAERNFYRFEVAVYDSPFDDGFAGGEPLVMRFKAEGRQKANGGISSWTSTNTLANGPYWEGLNNQTLTLGSNRYEGLLDYPTVTAYIAKDDSEWVGGQLNDVLAVQAVDMTALIN